LFSKKKLVVVSPDVQLFSQLPFVLEFRTKDIAHSRRIGYYQKELLCS